MSLARKDWVLLLLALRNADEPLDPVRVQTGMFLLSREGSLPKSSRYQFEALDAGPFSPQVESDLVLLDEEGLACRQMVAGVTWSEFTATDRGLQRAQDLLDDLTPIEHRALNKLADIKQDVLMLGFRDLMDYLKQRYPTFTRKSVFG